MHSYLISCLDKFHFLFGSVFSTAQSNHTKFQCKICWNNTIELKKCTMPGLANRLNLFEQMYKHLTRYIDKSKFEHCLSAKKVQGPKLITKEFLAKSDLNLCAQKYTICYVLPQIMVVNSFMAHLHANKLQCSSKQKVVSRDMGILLQ